MIRFLFFIFYFLFLSLSLIITHIFYFILPKKLKLSLKLKWKSILEFAKTDFQNQESILIHAASGEIEYAKPLIRELKKQHKSIFISYTSPSFLKLISPDIKDIKIFCLPFDIPLLTKWWLKKLNIKVIFYSRTDVWPWMAYTASQRKIPQILFSATFSKLIDRPSWLKNLYNRITLEKISQIHVVANKDTEYLERLNLKSCVVSGDTRFDQVQFRKTQQSPIEGLQKVFANCEKKLFTFGSTWPEDEKVLLPLLPELIKTRRIIFAPHEIPAGHLADLHAQFSKFAKVKYLSEILIQTTKPEAFDILLVDRIGYLFSLYEYSDVSFIGGSFRKNVHSVMEALAWGNVVLVGPYFHNNAEAVEFSHMPLENIQQFTSSKNQQSFQSLIENLESQDKFLHNNEFSPLYAVMSIKNADEFNEFYYPLDAYLKMHPTVSAEIAQAVQNKAGASAKICRMTFSSNLTN